MQTVIETKALCKQYGPHTAVDHVELHVPQGCVYGFIGPNGAGKSTTMKMLLGLIHPTAGRVRLLGQELTEKSRLPLLRQTGSLIESPGRVSASDRTGESGDRGRLKGCRPIRTSAACWTLCI